VVGRLGQLLGAAVGEVGFVNIPEELRAIEGQLGDVQAGIGHATAYADAYSDRQGIAHFDVAENRERFAKLMVLYSWAVSGDGQCIYSNSAPHLVLSVDHGHFFPGSTGWSLATLQAGQPVALDPLFNQCNFTGAELAVARDAIGAISEDDISLVVQGPPAEWGISGAERDALRQFLSSRRQGLLGALPI